MVGRDVSAFHLLRTGREGVAVEVVGSRVGPTAWERRRWGRTVREKEIQLVNDVGNIRYTVVVYIESVIAGAVWGVLTAVTEAAEKIDDIGEVTNAVRVGIAAYELTLVRNSIAIDIETGPVCNIALIGDAIQIAILAVTGTDVDGIENAVTVAIGAANLCSAHADCLSATFDSANTTITGEEDDLEANATVGYSSADE